MYQDDDEYLNEERGCGCRSAQSGNDVKVSSRNNAGQRAEQPSLWSIGTEGKLHQRRCHVTLLDGCCSSNTSRFHCGHWVTPTNHRSKSSGFWLLKLIVGSSQKKQSGN
ncbi:hypothetical protein Q5P01_021688 [Channa striata]|uniref:Uncharacterized protein n=1 Tax=Channa striata TaxID=64152 RepID=A0AA88S6V2_CHASR|nr:hypothetical protein Q5P01_021688 [Channa striata]